MFPHAYVTLGYSEHWAVLMGLFEATSRGCTQVMLVTAECWGQMARPMGFLLTLNAAW